MTVRKGMHESQMETARTMLEKNRGLSEIVSETGLSEADILKKRDKMQRRLDDKK
ncbi:hypothetical protein CPJCM30710_15750 [Clostridium polyendosporum]|uniref:Uncharacterized protein n=1 Tax=Clostridium polyendosporum TaxID=69208 RepID=A0A919RZZ6_9CLOT|nr:hypothetical protein [Clostridium polyendosporum]GIM28909.1 hypothetical protein CPJCM30710_15750 [Clostridium polyendosporum]